MKGERRWIRPVMSLRQFVGWMMRERCFDLENLCRCWRWYGHHGFCQCVCGNYWVGEMAWFSRFKPKEFSREG